MTGEFSSTWLTLREPADAAARAAALVGKLALTPPLVIRDLGCGTGSLGRGWRRCCPVRSTGSCRTGTRRCSRTRPRTCRTA